MTLFKSALSHKLFACANLNFEETFTQEKTSIQVNCTKIIRFKHVWGEHKTLQFSTCFIYELHTTLHFPNCYESEQYYFKEKAFNRKNKPGHKLHSTVCV